MKPAAKFGLVAAGYLLAFLAAMGVTALYVALTESPDRVASGGMYAFGDSLLFLAVFAAAAIPATGAAFYFLRPVRWFWQASAFGAVAVAVTGLAAGVILLVAARAAPGSAWHGWDALGVLRILAAPGFALGFLLAALFAPAWSFRLVFLAATAVEGLVFGVQVLRWVAG